MGVLSSSAKLFWKSFWIGRDKVSSSAYIYLETRRRPQPETTMLTTLLAGFAVGAVLTAVAASTAYMTWTILEAAFGDDE